MTMLLLLLLLRLLLLLMMVMMMMMMVMTMLTIQMRMRTTMLMPLQHLPLVMLPPTLPPTLMLLQLSMMLPNFVVVAAGIKLAAGPDAVATFVVDVVVIVAWCFHRCFC